MIRLRLLNQSITLARSHPHTLTVLDDLLISHVHIHFSSIQVVIQTTHSLLLLTKIRAELPIRYLLLILVTNFQHSPKIYCCVQQLFYQHLYYSLVIFSTLCLSIFMHLYEFSTHSVQMTNNTSSSSISALLLIISVLFELES